MISEARSVRSSVGFKISARVRQSSVTSNTLWATSNKFLWADYCTKIFCFCFHGGAPDHIYPGTYMNTFCECILKKIGLTHAHFQYNSRKLVDIVKLRFTMMYSSRKLNNKVIATACNFWTQIACSFWVYGFIVSMCSVQCFRGGHSLRLAFGSFFYRLILAVVCCCGQTFFFLHCFRLGLDFVQSMFIRNLGRQFWVRPCVWPWFLAWMFFLGVWYFMVGKFDNSLVAVFSGNECGFAFTCLAVKWLTNLAV